MNFMDPGWRENTSYPGTHWMFYNQRGHYKARVDFNTWTKGRFQWRVMSHIAGNDDVVGYEETLEAAQKAAEQAMSGKPYQMKLLFG